MRRPLRIEAAISALLLTALACGGGLAEDPRPRTASPPAVSSRPQTERPRPGAAIEGRIPFTANDPSVEPLIRAAASWRQARGPIRKVVDQVYLVPDESSFFEAIAGWDDRSYYPILIDDPAWSLPFLRAFRPARVVRFRSARADAPRKAAPARNERLLRWAAALRAVARSWGPDDVPADRLPSAARIPKHLGETPPGLVLSNGRSPTLAAAVALCAGRFQPLVEFDPPDPSLSKPFGHTLTLAEARTFARLVERRAQEVAGQGRGLGDACDFLTLAADWPYRYRNDAEASPFAGEAALDDLIGRVLPPGDGSLAGARERWAFTGRLVGGPAAAVYRAMCSLFLQPEDTLLWNTYGGGPPWSYYRMTEASELLDRVMGGASRWLLKQGGHANLPAWHEAVDPISRFGWYLVNTSGEPRAFSISGGTGRPSDLPRGVPSLVTIIHSHSAASPLDASTLAGRWLENGAFVYYGAMHEPFLTAFRTPQLIAQLGVAGIPLSAAHRQGAAEPFGRPWRLVYLGDPLYALALAKEPGRAREERLAPGPPAPLTTTRGRLTGTVISAEVEPPPPQGDELARLEACLSAALRSFCKGGPPGSARPPWQDELLKINRGRLDQRRQDDLDELVVDTLLHQGASDRLLPLLLAIPPSAAGPRLEGALETLLMARLMSLVAAKSIVPALDLWDGMIRRDWQAGNPFPSHLTERLAGLIKAGTPADREQYINRLTRARSALSARPAAAARRDLIAKELGRLGASSPAAR